MAVLIERFLYSNHGTFGILTLQNGWKCFTVERPWLNNEPSISCIPENKPGETYSLVKGYYNRGGYPAFHVELVPGRTLIKIHKANYPKDVSGCIGLGETLILNPNEGMGVYPSGTAFNEFMDLLAINRTELLIRSFDLTNVPS